MGHAGTYSTCQYWKRRTTSKQGGPGGHPPVAHFGSLWITLGHVESFFSPNVSHVGPCPVSNHEDLQRPRRCLSAPSVEVMADMAWRLWRSAVTVGTVGRESSQPYGVQGLGISQHLLWPVPVTETFHIFPLSITFHHFPSLSITFHHFPSLSITFHHFPSLSITFHHFPLAATSST